MIIRGGENIHPLEIENCLLAHPGVIDVSVVGVPDERYGEVVASFISARDQGSKMVTAEEIQQWVREHLSNHLGTYSLSNVVVSDITDIQVALQSLNTYSFWVLRKHSRRRQVEKFRSSSSKNRRSS